MPSAISRLASACPPACGPPTLWPAPQEPSQHEDAFAGDVHPPPLLGGAARDLLLGLLGLDMFLFVVRHGGAVVSGNASWKVTVEAEGVRDSLALHQRETYRVKEGEILRRMMSEDLEGAVANLG